MHTIAASIGLLITAAACTPNPAAVPGPSTSPPSTATARALLVATKQGRVVTVAAVDIGTDEVTELFTYRELAEATFEGGNFREGLTPSIGASPDGSVLAYAAADGLHVYDVATGASRHLIQRTDAGDPEAGREATWTPPLDRTFSLYEPVVSPDGRFVAFWQGLYEGAALALFDTATDTVIEPTMPTSYVPSLGSVRWAADANQWVVPIHGFEEIPPGWHRGSTDGDAIEFVLREPGSISDIALNPEGLRVAYLSSEDTDGPSNIVMAVPADGGDAFTRLDRGTEVTSVWYGDHPDTVWWVEANRVGATIKRSDGGEPTEVARLAGPNGWRFVSWPVEGIALQRRSAERGDAALFVVDPEKTAIVARHNSGSPFTTYLGLTDLPV